MSDERVVEVSPNPGLGGDKRAWARSLEERRAWVLHAPTHMVSWVKSFYDGEGKVYVSTSNGKAVSGPVLELEDGNAFVAADESLFVPLSQDEADYYLYALGKVGACAKEVAEFGAANRVRKSTALLLLGTTMRAVARVTDTASKTSPAPQGAPPVPKATGS